MCTPDMHKYMCSWPYSSIRIDEGLGKAQGGGQRSQGDSSIAQTSGPRHLFLEPQGRYPSLAPQALWPLASPSPLSTCSDLTCRYLIQDMQTRCWSHSQGIQLWALQPAAESRFSQVGVKRPYQKEKHSQGQHQDSNTRSDTQTAQTRAGESPV